MWPIEQPNPSIAKRWIPKIESGTESHPETRRLASSESRSSTLAPSPSKDLKVEAER